MQKKTNTGNVPVSRKIRNSQIICATLLFVYVLTTIPWYIIINGLKHGELLTYGICYHVVVAVLLFLVNGTILALAYIPGKGMTEEQFEAQKINAWKKLFITIAIIFVVTSAVGIPFSMYMIEQ